ncbi:phosphotransferase enzyme family protein [Streptomyces xiamenensis]|uniref:phosphotransferase enzyme family protein n=1 Tax=Streptomyces xiamenensis TaxID=408015 RepID=UPI0036F02D59
MEEKVRRWVRADFGVGLVSLEDVAGGADEAARLWRGRTDGGAAYAVKLSGGGSTAGLRVAGLLAAEEVPGVPGPLPARRGGWWSVRTGRRLSVVPWIDGTPALEGPMGAGHWRAFGRLLARVHAAPVPPGMPPAQSHRPMADAVRALERWLLPASGAAPAPAGDLLVRGLADAWREGSGRLAALVARAGALRPAATDGAAPGVICHADPHLGNVLLGDGDRVWLIDWDDAVCAAPEQDLLFVLGGVLPFAQVTDEQRTWFFEGYGPADLDPDRLTYYRCVRALEDVAVPAAQVLDREGLPEGERAGALEIVRSVLSPTGLLDQALSSPGQVSYRPSQGAENPSRSG